MTDLLGNALSGVAVTDGNQTVFTNSSGDYALPEDSLNDQILSFSRSGLETVREVRVTATQAATTTIQTQMTYRLTLTMSPQTLNNATTSTTTAQVVSHVPASSCLTWTDAHSSKSQAMTFISTDGQGRSTWRTTFEATGRFDGSYSHSAIAKVCSSGQALSTTASGLFTVDTRSPSLGVVVPLPNGNTVFTNQKIVVSLNDIRPDTNQTGSGVNPSTVAISVTDATGAEAARTPSVSTTGGYARSANLSPALTPGKTYNLTVTGADYAGNTGSASSQFRVITSASTTAANQITAAIAEKLATSKAPGGTLETTDTYTFNNLKGSLGAFDIDIDSTLHAGEGSVNVTIPTADAVVTYTIGGVPGLPVDVIEPETKTKVSFSTGNTGVVSIPVAAQGDLPLTTLTARVPKGADDGSVKISFGGYASATSFPTCIDPTVTGNCSTDPIATVGPSFFGTVDMALAGGEWVLSTMQGTNSDVNKKLASGTVPTDGRIFAAFTSADLRAATTNHQIVLHAVKRTSETEGHAATASVGMTEADIASGVWTNLGALASEAVTFYPTVEEATASSECGPSCVPDGSIYSGDTIVSDPVALTMTENGSGPAPPEGTGPETGAPELECVATHNCGMPGAKANASAASQSDCAPGFGYSDCVVSFRDRHGVPALRGFSPKPLGVSTTFSVEVGTTQKWQNGVRMKAGPFKIDGDTTRKKTDSQNDTWQRRHDCGWSSSDGNSAPAAGQPCETVGRRPARGQDTWRWEKRLVVHCSGYSCGHYFYERHYNYRYDGGQAWDRNTYPAPDRMRPALVRRGDYGRWGIYERGTAGSVTHALETSTELGNGASMSINYPEAFSSVEFTASVTNTSLKKVTNKYEFRNELTGFHAWYRYDNKSDFRWEYWTCEAAPDWRVEGCHNYGM